MIYTSVGIFVANIYWPTMIRLFVLCSIINCCGTLLISQFNISVDLCYFKTQQFFSRQRNSLYLFLIHKNKCRYQVPFITQSNHWNTEEYWGLNNFCWWDLDSESNRLASVNLWKYTTVSHKCEWFPSNWAWYLIYVDYWYNFGKRRGSV